MFSLCFSDTLMLEPMILPDCGHTFCKTCISNVCKRKHFEGDGVTQQEASRKDVSLLTEKSEKLLDLFLKKVRLTEANAPKCFPLSIFNCYLIARAQVTDF